MTAAAVDLNCDLGEGLSLYRLGDDAALLDIVTSANIACGFHAGDPAIMARTVRLAAERGVAIGAHPGLPDLQGFGRRDMAITADEAYQIVLYQIGALSGFAHAIGARLHHVKPHGALYNMAAADPGLARAIARAVRDFDPALHLVGLAGSELMRKAESAGLRAVSEVFADRAYRSDGSLVSRATPGAVIHDVGAVVARALQMVRSGTVESIDGITLPIVAHTICVHGDTPGAVALAQALRDALTAEGIELRAT